MGQDSSTSKKSAALADGDYGRPAPQARASLPASVPSSSYEASRPVPIFVGAQQRVITDPLASTILEALPTAYQPCEKSVQWFQLYSSHTNGKSFQRLVQSITERGPTVLVIKVKNSSRLVGAFCDSDWLTVAAREKQAVSNAAARQRAVREGQRHSGVQNKPENQNNVFFGSEPCFLFSAGGEGPARVQHTGVVYRARSFANSNFMYLFDTHPQDDKIGIGMGGQPGYFGWFMDRWLERGECKGLKCTTFQNPRLTEEESWEVETVEAYAVKPEVVAKLIAEREHGSSGGGGSSSVLKRNPDSEADKMLLELHGVHKFDAGERPDC